MPYACMGPGQACPMRAWVRVRHALCVHGSGSGIPYVCMGPGQACPMRASVQVSWTRCVPSDDVVLRTLLLPATACLLLPANATACCHPQVVVLRHLDVTAKHEEASGGKELAQLTEATLSLLELIFPRHIIEYMTNEAASAEEDEEEAAAVAGPWGGGVKPALSLNRSAASLCINTLSKGKDYRHLTTRHEQVGPPS